MRYNLAILNKTKRNEINVDLAASAIAFRERYNMPVSIEQVEHEQPVQLRKYFRMRLIFYRQISLDFSRQHNAPHN